MPPAAGAAGAAADANKRKHLVSRARPADKAPPAAQPDELGADAPTSENQQRYLCNSSQYK